MKTLTETLLVAAFVFCVAYAALHGGIVPILAAGATAALLIGGADRTCPAYGYVPGSRSTKRIDRDIRHLQRQIRLWWMFIAVPSAVILCISASFLAGRVWADGFPGNWVRFDPFGLQREAVMLGLVVSAVLLFLITVVVGCIQPLEAAMQVLRNERALSADAEASRDATVGNPDWRACNQADWDDPAVSQRLQRQRERRLFGDATTEG